jgi:hypothetical protein
MRRRYNRSIDRNYSVNFCKEISRSISKLMALSKKVVPMSQPLSPSIRPIRVVVTRETNQLPARCHLEPVSLSPRGRRVFTLRHLKMRRNKKNRKIQMNRCFKEQLKTFIRGEDPPIATGYRRQIRRFLW